MAINSWKVTNNIRCRNRHINSGKCTVGKDISRRYIQDDHIGVWSLWLGGKCTLNLNVLPDLYQMKGEKQAKIVCSTGQMIHILGFWNTSKFKIGESRCLQETRTYYLHLPHYIWEGFQREEIENVTNWIERSTYRSMVRFPTVLLIYKGEQIVILP